MGELLTMSQKEIYRIEVMGLLEQGIIKIEDAAKRLKLSRRQTIRIKKKYRAEGASGLISKKRGKPSNRAYSEELKKRVRQLVEANYCDFGPKFAAEKLQEDENISLDKETLRKLMTKWGLWKPKQKCCVIHQQRQRRQCFGELIQIDGSHHDWFEGRGKKCCLIVFVDDATSKLVGMHFAEVESAQAYFGCVKKYIKRYGRPLAFYSDRHGIFRVNNPDVENGETQFKRAMQELDIETICAHSPQAKGRVERANRTLQDRLIKEMRLRGISDIATANNYVEEFMEKHNKKFEKTAADTKDLHRKVIPEDRILDSVLCERYYRKLSKNLEFNFECKTYQIVNRAVHMGRSHVVVCRNARNEIKVWHENNFIECKEFKQRQQTTIITSGKELNEAVNKLCPEAISQKVSKRRPWKQVPFLRAISR
jgi:transposase